MRGTIAHDVLRAKCLDKVEIHYGASKHWKGAWDRRLGHLGHVFKSAAKQHYMNSVSDVVLQYEAWAKEQMRLYPTGPRIIVKEYLPPPKSQCSYTRFATK